ncbi:UvrD-helicase domain-containing protein [Candidatus Dependentiae bacterium]|nr:UvrD-helicase domain-containing protein [Candidatus Dependentiae bacterium]
MNIKNNFEQFYNNQLNDAQKKAVKDKNAVLLVCAGAGSGKTRVITARMVNLINNHNVSPSNIVALTFTNKAAKEMKERISRFLDLPILPYVGTFHSYCLKILKLNSKLISIPDFAILDDDDQEKLIKEIINKKGLQKRINAKQALGYISRLKNEHYSYKDISNNLGFEPLIKDLYLTYEKEKTNSKCYDFDDLLLQTLKLFHENPTFKENFQNEVRHILVDEYQDTNKVQHELLKAMCLSKQKKFNLDSLCVVGDEDQSIYSWRGANVTNMINFKDDFPECKSIAIEQNYRSVQPILNVANHVIEFNQNRNEKKLWSTKQGQDRIRLISCNSVYQEAEAIALLLKMQKNKNKLNDFAILYRSHYQSRPLEEALLRYSIPYLIIGGIQFYERQEIKDLLAYLKLIANPFDRISLMRVINCPTRGIGDKFQEFIFEKWQLQPFSNFKELCKDIIDSNDITKKQKESLSSFLAIFKTFEKLESPSEILDKLISKIDYLNYLKESFNEEEAQAKTENVKEFLASISYAENNGTKSLSQLLEEIALLQETIKKSVKEQDCVKLMSLHAAKGLEFENVILCGLEEGILPSTHSLHNPERLEEERRLLYVGITRAQERLLISHARQRYTYGTITEQLPSRFIDELPAKFVKKEECHYWSPAYFINYFSQWMDQSVLETTKKISELSENKVKKPIWKAKQKVQHGKFGYGVVEKIESKDNGKIVATVKFETGTKKIDTSFLKETSAPETD